MKQRIIAETQYRLSAADLEVVLALSRGATLAAAGERLGLDASTIFRSLQRLERNLGQHLFERSRSGYLPTEAAAQLAAHAEEMEVALESARSAIESAPSQVSGSVRVTTADTICMARGAGAHAASEGSPLLTFELHRQRFASPHGATPTSRCAHQAAPRRPSAAACGYRPHRGVRREASRRAEMVGRGRGQVDWTSVDDAARAPP
jgi:hypothetical protein